MKYSRYIPEFEAETGKKASEVLKKFAASLDALVQKGRRAAQNGKPPLDLDDFVSLIARDKDIILAELMYECYMEGYNTGKAVE